MNKSKKVILGLLAASLILGGCSLNSKTANTEQKLQENVVTKTGTITTKAGDEYLLKTDDEIVNVTSNKVNLDQYIKKPIRVNGMFSGTTLYVDKVESAITN